MPLSIAERKYRMPHGALQQVARSEGVANSYVTAVMNGTVMPRSPLARKKLRRVRVALARKLGLRVDEVFGPATTSAETEPVAIPA